MKPTSNIYHYLPLMVAQNYEEMWNLKGVNLKNIIQVSDNMEVDKINSWMKMNTGMKWIQ